jgi:hypothetical protein
MEHDISNMIENVQNHKYPFCIIKPIPGKKGRETMADLALVLDCKVLKESPVLTMMVKTLHLGTCDRMK